MIHAQPPLEFIPPAFTPLTLRIAQAVLPTWVRFQTEITDIQVENIDTLVNLYSEFQSGKTRFLLAFRHPSTRDPVCIARLLWQMVPAAARRQGTSLKRPIHAHFIYDRGIPLWAGSWMGRLYAQLGGVPIHRGKIDLMGLRVARDLFANGSFPIAAAPEGATNGHNEIVSSVEPGIAQLGFWCAEDLLKAGRSEQVLILPLGIQYQYVEAPWKPLEKLLNELEADAGISPTASYNNSHNKTLTANQEKALYDRLHRLGEHFLSLMEEFYTRFYNQSLSTATTVSTANQKAQDPFPPSDPSPEANQELADRLQRLLNAGLQVAEQYFGLAPKGSVIDRCRRLEQAGWDRIYREDFKQTQTLSPVERGLADRVAEEANLRMWHMRLVETFVAVTGKYVREKPTVERFAETTLLLWDMVTRIKGRNPFYRPQLGKQRVQLTVGQPISVSERWEDYKTGRRQAIATLTTDLQASLESMILERR